MTQRSPSSTMVRRLALVAVACLALTACLPGGGDEGDAADSAATGDGATAGTGSPGAQAAGEEPDELVVWDIYVRGTEREVAERLTTRFEEEHGVTVTREPKNLDDLKATLPLAMRQPDGPDVASVNQGRADMGAMVAAGDLMDLTKFGREQGWFEVWGENLLSRNMFTEDGEDFGTGNLYGVAPQAEVVGWFYNKDIFSEHGLEPPATFAELEQLLADLEEAGETAITFGNVEGWPAIHTYGAVQHTLVDTEYLDSLVFEPNSVSFDTEENAQAAEILQGWADAGYFTENFSGISYDDSWAQFAAGEGAMLLTGSWIAGEFDPEQFGFFLTPGQEEGTLPPQTGGMGVPLGIRASTEAPELARQYVDWMTSEEAAQEWVQAWLPSRAPSAEAVSEPLMGDLVAAWERILSEQQLGHYLDWASPTFYDSLTAQLQQLLSGGVDPQTFVSTLQSEYAASVED